MINSRNLIYTNILDLTLLAGYQESEAGLKVYADINSVNQATITRWIKRFLLHGLAGVCAHDIYLAA